MRRGLTVLLCSTLVMFFLLSNFPLLNAQELPLDLRWAGTCPDRIRHARLTDLDQDGEKELAYTHVTSDVSSYLRTYRITPEELILAGHHTLPFPDGLSPAGRFDLMDINADSQFDMLVKCGEQRLYILYGPEFTAGNYYQWSHYGLSTWANSVDIKSDPDHASVLLCYGGYDISHTYTTEWNHCSKLTLPEFAAVGGVHCGLKHPWEGIDDFSRGTVYLFSNYSYWLSGPYPWENEMIYGFTITGEDLAMVDEVLWRETRRRGRPLCFAGHLDLDSEIEFLMSHELTLRCYDLREGDLELKWYREDIADEYLSALDVTGDGVEEAIVADSAGQIWAIEGENGNTIAAGSIGHQVSNMFFTKHQETGRNFLICYENGDQPILYLYEIGSPTGIEDDKAQEQSPTDFTLKQNYPNPFNSVTQIEYFLHRDGDVSLKVFDLAGSLLVTLQEGRKKAGKHVIEWNGEGFASGIYFYRLTAGESTQTKKMILLK